MAGASSRARGCRQCLARRTKCDEARPTCGNCVKYNTPCPGSQRGPKLFVAGKHAVRPRGRQQQQHSSRASPVVHVGRPRPDSEQKAQKALVLGPVKGHRREGCVHRSPQPVTALEKLQAAAVRKQKVPGTLRHNTTQFVGALLESLRYALPRDRKLPMQTWLHGAASRMHRSPALETAACAFGSHIVGQHYNNENVSTESRLAYRKSLWYLQRALYHPHEWKSSETLGALLILCYYQVLTRSGSKHEARGVTRLVQVRGVRTSIEPWESAILQCLEAHGAHVF